MRDHLVRRMNWVYGPTTCAANVVGAAVVFGFLAYLLPVSERDLAHADEQRSLNTWAFLAYMAVAMLIGNAWGTRRSRTVVDWVNGDAPPGPAERTAVLRLPWLQAQVNAALWLLAAVVFGLLNVRYSASVAVEIAGTIVMGGFTTCALGYLIAERVLRPVVTEAMQGSTEAPARVVGVKERVLLAWALGTGVPLAGVALSMVEIHDRPALSTGAQLFLVGVAGLIGAVAILAAAGAVSDPVGSVAGALREVGRGNLDVAVPVYDASEVGQLQSGFNTMVRGLREHERLRDLYGRQVGLDVARLSVEQGVALGGERRDVAVLFVDVIGSTALTETLGPDEVVARLNAFFEVVVDVVTGHGGWVNKFEGDATLCVFGAPVEVADPAGAALAAAREVAERLRPLPLDAGIGVSAGPVVAGHVGSASRFEYTVVGDPVNTAARLSERAKGDPLCVLADGRAVAVAGADERAQWEALEDAVLRGRSTPTSVFRPLS